MCFVETFLSKMMHRPKESGMESPRNTHKTQKKRKGLLELPSFRFWFGHYFTFAAAANIFASSKEFVG